MKTPHFPISGQRNRSSQSVVLHQLLRELQWTVTHSTVIAHQLRSAAFLTLMISAAQAAMNWQNMSICQYVAVPELQWEWEGMGITNGNGKGMGIKLG